MNILASSSVFRFRWINGQCFEFRLPNGKYLITDPWYQCEGSMGRTCPEDFSTDDLEGCDYLVINHCHGDHIANLQDVYDRFHPVVITHSAACMEIAKTFHIPLTSIYPVDFDGTYYFDGFMMEPYHGVHHALSWNYEETKATFESLPVSPELNVLGGMFNMNFVLTTEQGFRIAFIGGNDDGMLKRLQNKEKPNLVIRNKMASSKHKDTAAEQFSKWFSEIDVPILVPMHHENWLVDDPEFTKNLFSQMNQYMVANKKIGRVASMDRCRWYTVNVSVVEAE